MRDEILEKLERIKNSDTIPPFCFEIFLRDGRSYFIFSVTYCEKKSEIIECKIWDTRFLSDVEENKIKNLKLENFEFNEFVENNKIDWANLKVYKKDIMYTIEWHDKFLEEEKIGFKNKNNNL